MLFKLAPAGEVRVMGTLHGFNIGAGTVRRMNGLGWALCMPSVLILTGTAIAANIPATTTRTARATITVGKPARIKLLLYAASQLVRHKAVFVG